MRCGLSSHPFHTNLHCHPLLISLIWIPCQLILENNRFPTTVYKLLQTPARPQMHAEECLLGLFRISIVIANTFSSGNRFSLG